MKVKNNIFTQKQHEKLHKLWKIYGNNGNKHTLTGHKFIQSFIADLKLKMRDDNFAIYFEKMRKFYKIKKTDELYKDVYNIIKSCLQ